jgi:hypothetical protein
MSEQQTNEQTARYVYKFSYHPQPPKKAEDVEISTSELQAYINNLLGIRKEPSERIA